MPQQPHAVSKYYTEYLALLDAGERDKATHALNEAVREGDPMAMHALAYDAETSIPARTQEAIKLYKAAARRGYEPSMVNLARFYERLGGVRRYLYWLKKSATLGNPDSIAELRNPLPYMVRRAYKVFKEGRVEEAISLYSVAASRGNVNAAIDLANILDTKLNPPNKRRAVRLYQKAVQAGSGLAAFNLARHYYDSDRRDRYEEYLRKSAEMGYGQAKKELRSIT